MADVGQEAEALTVVLTRLASTPDEALEKVRGEQGRAHVALDGCSRLSLFHIPNQ